MSRDWRLFLDDIRQAGTRIAGYTEGMSKEDFIGDSRTRDAVIRNIEIIGEAAKRLPDEVVTRYQGINWRRIAAMRNLLAHAYFGIDDDILWDVIKNHVPQLMMRLEPGDDTPTGH